MARSFPELPINKGSYRGIVYRYRRSGRFLWSCHSIDGMLYRPGWTGMTELRLRKKIHRYIDKRFKQVERGW